MNPSITTWVQSSRALPTESRQTRRSRSGWRSASPGSSTSDRIGPATMKVTARIAATSETPASATSAAREPQWSAMGGMPRAATNPPIGTEVWRIPSANPRCSRGNQLITTRAVAVFALYLRDLAGAWRWTYVAAAVLALYFNVLVLIVQSFQKISLLHALAPTQSEPPFLMAQVGTLVAFVVVGIAAAIKFHPAPSSRPT